MLTPLLTLIVRVDNRLQRHRVPPVLCCFSLFFFTCYNFVLFSFPHDVPNYPQASISRPSLCLPLTLSPHPVHLWAFWGYAKPLVVYS